jgi:hypothetical protein
MRIRVKAVWGLLVLAACTDLPNEPRQPVVPAGATAAKGGVQGGNGKSSLDLIEDDLTAGVLDKQNGNVYREAAVSDQSQLPAKYQSTVKAKDGTLAMVQMAKDWSSLSKSTQQQILDMRAKGLGQLSQTVETRHFALHYTTIGNHSVPLIDTNRNGVPDFIDVAAQTVEAVWQREVQQLGYPAPLGTPAQKFNVYFRDLRNVYGLTYPEHVTVQATTPVPLGVATGYIVVENDFSEGFPPNDEDRTGTEPIRSGALKVTLAHEFMHAIQFNINVLQSGWLMESHATWAEDAVFDGINDWHWYINGFFATADLPLFARDPYGGAFFQNWLSERNGVDIERQIWMAAKTNTLQDAIRSTAFAGTWEPLETFAAAEYTLGISDFTTDGPTVIPLPKTLPIRETHTTYPVAEIVSASTKKVPNLAPWAYGGANYVEFTPAGNGSLTIAFDGADAVDWRAVVVATPKSGGAATIFPITLSSAGAGTITISSFGSNWSKLTLVPSIVGTDGVQVPFAYSAHY